MDNWKHTPKEYREKFEVMWGDRFVLLTEYSGPGCEVRATCKECGNSYTKNALRFLRFGGCMMCPRIKRAKDFRDKLGEKWHGKMDVLGDYRNATDFLKAQCRICGVITEQLPKVLLAEGCGLCEMRDSGEIVYLKKFRRY